MVFKAGVLSILPVRDWPVQPHSHLGQWPGSHSLSQSGPAQSRLRDLRQELRHRVGISRSWARPRTALRLQLQQHHDPRQHRNVLGAPVSEKTAADITSKALEREFLDSGRQHTDHKSDSGIFLASGTSGVTVSGNKASWNAQGYQRNANGINVIASGNVLIGNILQDNEDSGIQFFRGNNNLAAANVTMGASEIASRVPQGRRAVVPRTVARSTPRGTSWSCGRTPSFAGMPHFVKRTSADQPCLPRCREIVRVGARPGCLGRTFSASTSSRRFASSAFSPPYGARER